MVTKKAPERKKRESVVDPNETKSDKFKRLAKVRVTKALKAIAQLENLSGSNYEYTPEQASTIVAALKEATHKVDVAMQKTAKKSEISFDFEAD